MACEIPVIATNVGGVPKIVAHNETGILLAENSVDLLIEHLYELLTDEARAKAFGALARTKVLDNYSWEARANYFNAIFEKLKNNSLTASGKKIALVTPYFYPKAGGLENYALEMGRALKRTGHDVLVITSSHAKKGWVYEEIEGIRIYRMPILFKISNTPINFMWLLWIRNILGNEKPDIINAHTPVPFIADMAERVRGHTPFVLNYHNDLVKSDFIPSMLCKLEYFFLTNRTLRKSDMIIATSEYYAKRSPYLRKFYKKINFVPPGVDMTRFMLGLETPYFTSRFKDFSTVLFVGQLDRTHRHKGLSDLLVAISLLKEAVPTIKLIVVGRGNEIPVYKEEAKALGIEDSVSFEGFVSDELLPQYYAGADLLALPSRDEAEGFGMVITEAAACGTPSVATNVGGVPAALIDGVTGYLVPPSNPQVLSQKIKELLSDKEHAARLGHNAYERIKKDFSLPVVTSIFVDSISSLL
jgi:glycosyltransferase involved in cell wall biosynthesis